jgi:hypothetical protein
MLMAGSTNLNIVSNTANKYKMVIIDEVRRRELSLPFNTVHPIDIEIHTPTPPDL